MKANVLKALLLSLVVPYLASCSHSSDTGSAACGRATSKHKNIRIVIDAGHGGEDYGTHSNNKPRQHEKYLSLSTALMLRDHLNRMGYQTFLSRSKDEFISLPNRVSLASKKRATLFVSVHYNSAPNVKAHGVEVFYYRPKKVNERSEVSSKLAEAVLGRVLKNTQAKSRGVKHGNFAVVRDTNMPAVLIEGGFLTNTGELKKLRDPAYLNRVAKGIAQGINDYVTAR